MPPNACDDDAYDPEALFHQNGPINPIFVNDAVRTLMRAMPLADRTEPRGWVTRRMFTAMRALTALPPPRRNRTHARGPGTSAPTRPRPHFGEPA